jgi:hypothetical protein
MLSPRPGSCGRGHDHPLRHQPARRCARRWQHHALRAVPGRAARALGDGCVASTPPSGLVVMRTSGGCAAACRSSPAAEGLNLPWPLVFPVAAVTLHLCRSGRSWPDTSSSPCRPAVLPQPPAAFGRKDAAAQTIALTAVAVLPVALLALTRRRPTTPAVFPPGDTTAPSPATSIVNPRRRPVAGRRGRDRRPVRTTRPPCAAGHTATPTDGVRGRPTGPDADDPGWAVQS